MKRVLMITLLLLAVACKSGDNGLLEPSAELSVEQSAITVDYNTQSVTIDVVSNTAIEVKSSEYWAIVDSVIETETGYMVNIGLLENGSDADRKATVTVTAGEITASVTITQCVKPEVMTLVLRHTDEHLQSPVWGGERVTGVVDWGDGVTEEYEEGIAHDYTAAESHTATFEMEGATLFTIERVGNIEYFEIKLK
ncbi:MAG: BACON domain-containing protein [Alistipes sp.]|nr:BACON domain-containing protein [Alistipes sp.]